MLYYWIMIWSGWLEVKQCTPDQRVTVEGKTLSCLAEAASKHGSVNTTAAWHHQVVLADSQQSAWPLSRCFEIHCQINIYYDQNKPLACSASNEWSRPTEYKFINMSTRILINVSAAWPLSSVNFVLSWSIIICKALSLAEHLKLIMLATLLQPILYLKNRTA